MTIKGFVTFYVNFPPDLDQKITESLDFIRKYNAEVIEKLREVNYEVMFVPVTKESSRIEKIDMSKPYVLGETTSDEGEE